MANVNTLSNFFSKTSSANVIDTYAVFRETKDNIPSSEFLTDERKNRKNRYISTTQEPEFGGVLEITYKDGEDNSETDDVLIIEFQDRDTSIKNTFLNFSSLVTELTAENSDDKEGCVNVYAIHYNNEKQLLAENLVPNKIKLVLQENGKAQIEREGALVDAGFVYFTSATKTEQDPDGSLLFSLDENTESSVILPLENQQITKNMINNFCIELMRSLGIKAEIENHICESLFVKEGIFSASPMMTLSLYDDNEENRVKTIDKEYDAEITVPETVLNRKIEYIDDIHFLIKRAEDIGETKIIVPSSINLYPNATSTPRGFAYTQGFDYIEFKNYPKDDDEIPDRVINIPNGCFYKSGFKKVILDSHVSIGSIGSMAFQGCERLEIDDEFWNKVADYSVQPDAFDESIFVPENKIARNENIINE